jgi:GrpB-like predicted nucleotidyltransferase (UPF0157 family)
MAEGTFVPAPYLRAGEPLVVDAYDAGWPLLFREEAGKMRRALGDVALGIDHIGSTAVPGLAAKPIIDIQIAVSQFEPLVAYRGPLETLGYVYRADNSDRTKRYFRETPGARRTHIHIRKHGSWSEQFALLFRDFLRCHPQHAEEYAALKLELIKRQDGFDGRGYTEAKAPLIWSIMRQASDWSQQVGWEPGPSDA